MNIFDMLRHLLYPRRCLACDEILDIRNNQNLYCPACKPIVRFTGKNVCMKCGKPLKDATKEYCRDCLVKKHYFTQAKACFVYFGPMKTSMYAFKYGNRRAKAKDYVKEILRTNGRWLYEIDVDYIIAVPMYLKKEKRRGYNQAKVLAKELSKAIKVPFLEDAVLRINNTKPMKELDAAGRRSNLEKAFILNTSVVKLRKILLVDDIYTTGSTYDAVSEVLLKGGAESIYCMSICTGDDR